MSFCLRSSLWAFGKKTFEFFLNAIFRIHMSLFYVNQTEIKHEHTHTDTHA